MHTEKHRRKAGHSEPPPTARNNFNPALNHLLSCFSDELIFAEVLIRRRGSRFELRHADDRSRKAAELKSLPLDQLRRLAQFTAQGMFRPLKSAPNLQAGWKSTLQSAAELGTALNHLYPGAIANWHAAHSGKPPVTHYRKFTGRQSGMYRITQKPTDAQAGETIRACCHEGSCLKQRLWTVRGLSPDSPAEKSVIPCLEPCAILLEFARKSMRIEQEDTLELKLPPSDLQTLVDALQRALAYPDPSILEADMNAPTNSRRLRRVLQRLESRMRSQGAVAAKSERPVDSRDR